ncbi:MAG: putative repeat protein, partial [Ignavibacteria bacterium]|nr:putative repeat protein [Ignavibacteria bacterium]
NIPEKTGFQIEIYNSLGNKVRTISNYGNSLGNYNVNWDGMDNSGQLVPNGIYYCHLIAGSVIDIKGITIIR